MTKDEALRLALEALKLVSIEFVCNGAHHAKKDRHEWLDPCPIVDRYKEAITAIKAALEAKDEPVAWMRTSGTGSPVVTEALLVEMPEMRWNFQQPLYTYPPQRKPLTNEQAMDAYFETPPFGTYKEAFIAGIRFIEAAHGIKETEV